MAHIQEERQEHQILRRMLNVSYKKLPQELTSNDPSVCGLGTGLTTSEHKKVECSEKLQSISDLGRVYGK